MKLIDSEFHFKGFGNCASRCRVRIYEVEKPAPRLDPNLSVPPEIAQAAMKVCDYAIQQGWKDWELGGLAQRKATSAIRQLHAGDKVVILTQLEGENVGTSVTNASEVIANAVAEQFKLEPLRTIWIEHYQDRNKGNVWKSVSEQETFDRVTYTYESQAVHHFTSARWNHLTREIVASLIGEEP